MSIESAKKLIQKMGTDAAFRDSLKNASDDKARHEIAVKHGFDCTRAEVESLLPGGHNAGEISDADLEAVAGGKGVSVVVSAAISAAAVA